MGLPKVRELTTQLRDCLLEVEERTSEIKYKVKKVIEGAFASYIRY